MYLPSIMTTIIRSYRGIHLNATEQIETPEARRFREIDAR
jgi:hypothetical protein